MLNNVRLKHIDSIRAIAALLVVWQHTSEVFRDITNSGIWLFQIANAVDFGRIGVVIFFCVSGFVIPSSLKGEKLAGIKQFVTKRFFRLYPAYWVSIPLGWFTSWYIWGKHISLKEVLLNFTMLPEFFHVTSIEGLYWTLQTELFFYLICVCLFALNFLHKEKVLGIISLALLGFYLEQFLAGKANPTILHLSIMFWGALFRKYYDGNKDKFTYAALAIFWLLIVIGLPAWGYKQIGIVGYDEFVLKFVSSYVISMIIFIVFALFIKIENPSLSYMGEISYSIYLFHPVVFYPIFKLAGYFSWMYNHHLSIYMLISTILTIVFATITYKYIEIPFINKGKAVSKNLL